MITRSGKSILKEILLLHHYDYIIKPFDLKIIDDLENIYNWNNRDIGENSKFIENPFIYSDTLTISRYNFNSNKVEFKLELCPATGMEGIYSKYTQCENFDKWEDNWTILYVGDCDGLINFLYSDLEKKINKYKTGLVYSNFNKMDIYKYWYICGIV